jgi:glycine hydroxymethyltransferase
VDLRPKGLKGTQVEQALERAGITCNKNGIPFDTEKPTITSGVRLGTPAATTRGFGVSEFREVGRLILDVFEALRAHPDGDRATEQRVRREIFALCERFPIY